MSAGNTIDAINPIQQIGEAKYTAIWHKLFATVLSGFWAHALFLIFIALTIYVGILRRNPRAAAFFALCAVLTAYGGVILKLSIFRAFLGGVHG